MKLGATLTTEKKPVKQQYITMLICWLAYVTVTFARYSYIANIALVESDYGVTHASAGLVITFFSITYGIGQVINGIFCARYPRRAIVSLSLIGSAACEFLICTRVSFYLIKYIWLFNACFQSLLWPMLMQIISENVSPKLRSKAVLVMSTTTSAGIFLIYGVSALVVKISNFRQTFFIGTLVLVLVALIWFILYKPGKYMKISSFAKKNESAENEKKSTVKAVVIIPVVIVCIFGVVVSFVKDGLQTWVPVILKDIHKMPDSMSILLTIFLPLFGIFGATLTVYLNKVITKLIVLFMLLFTFTAGFNIIVLNFKDNLFILIASFALLELFLHGASNICVSIFPLAMCEKLSAGLIAGIVNGASYVGSSLSSFVLGKIADISGWNAVFGTILGTVITVMIIAAAYYFLSLKKRELRL